MKKIIGISALAISLTLMTWAAPLNSASPPVDVSISMEVFYSELAPYGEWIDDPYYGYVWIPTIGPGFRPYFSSGYWVMTGYGNMWVSDYPWGWAPFHYGRWTYDSFYGWVWIPDVVWGPAWVSWRTGPGYCGWAPLGPGVSLSVAFTSYAPPADWWVFLPPTYIHHHHWHTYYVAPRNNITIIHNTTIINHSFKERNRTFIYGPRIDEIKKATNKDVTVYNVKDENRPVRSSVQSTSVNVYRPAVEKSGRGIAPKSVVKAERQIGKPASVEEGSKSPEQRQIKNTGSEKRVTPGQQQRQPAGKDYPADRVKQPVKKVSPDSKQNEPAQRNIPHPKPDQPVKGKSGQEIREPVKKQSPEKKPAYDQKPVQKRQPEMKQSPGKQSKEPVMKRSIEHKGAQNKIPQKQAPRGKKEPRKK